MKKIILVLSVTLSVQCITFAQAKKTTPKTNSKTNTNPKDKNVINTTNDKLSYAIGTSIAGNIKSQGIDTLNIKLLTKAFEDVYAGNKPLLTPEEAGAFLNQYFGELQKAKLNKNKIAGEKFLEDNKKKPGIVTLPSGLQYQVITEGTGPIPTATDKVKTHYHGTLIDGTVFDSSVQRGEPASFPVNGVIQGWQEALQLMKVGSKWKLFVPANLAYGERGAGEKIGPNTALIFDVELISIEK
jgi:FKBP-type peptidyl-prolyl cis-trans isomerase FklB